MLDPESTDQPFNLREEPQCKRCAAVKLTVLDLQNQVAHSLTLLFLLSYTTTWTSFFNDFIALIQRNAVQRQLFDPFSTQIFLRILLMIDEEVADALYTFSKKAGDQRLNTEIKDRIRAFDVGNIFRLLFELMTAYQGQDEQDALVRLCLSVIGQWIGNCLSFVSNCAKPGSTLL
jgi:exportin-T